MYTNIYSSTGTAYMLKDTYNQCFGSVFNWIRIPAKDLNPDPDQECAWIRILDIFTNWKYKIISQLYHCIIKRSQLMDIKL